MDSGYTLLYRKIWKNKFLSEPGKRYSRFEAFLYLVNLRAKGIDRDGLKRGEFDDSVRYLAAAWNWSIDATHRFLKGLERENMIAKVPSDPERFAERQTEHFIVCNYETYNPTPNAQPNALPNEYKKDKRKTKELFITGAQNVSDVPRPEESKFTIPLKDGSQFPIPARQVEIYRIAYRNVEVEAELLRYIAWAESNPAKRKTRRGILRSVNSWLEDKDRAAKSQNIIANLKIGSAL